MATSGALSTSNSYIKYTISVTQNSQSIDGNYSNVTVSVRFYRTNSGYTTYGTGTVYCKINGTTYSASVTSSQKITSSGIVLYTGTVNVPHNDDGTKDLTCSAWISHSQFSASEQSYTQTLTTIPRASTMGVYGAIIGNTVTFEISAASSSFTHSLEYTFGSTTGLILDVVSAGSYTWTPPLTLANQIPNSTSGSMTYKLYTFNSGTTVGTKTYTFTYSLPSSVKPSCSLTLSDASGHLSTYGAYIQGQSKIGISVSASGIYGSSIKSYSTTADGKTYTAASATTPAISGTGTLTVNTTVTDSRNRTATASKSISVLAYSYPKITAFDIKRCDSDGTANSSGAYLGVTFSATVTALSNKNSAAYTVKYKKASETTYTTATLSAYAGNYSVSGGVFVFTADTAATYDVTLTATDAFSSSTKSGQGGPITKVFSIHNKGTGIAFGKVSETENAIETPWDIITSGTIKIDDIPVFANQGTFSGTDFDDLTIAPGIYWCDLSGISNGPATSGYGWLIVYPNQKVQEFIIYSTHITYTRGYTNSQWYSWKCTGGQDSITVYGTSGIWKYVKYDSGLAMCWGRTSFTVACSTAFGGVYKSADSAIASQSYPFSFKEIYSQMATATANSYTGWLLSTSAGSVSATQAFALVRGTSVSSVKVYVEYQTAGRWK